MTRILWLVAGLALAGCAEFNTSVQKPELLPGYDAQRGAIEAGRTTRAEVRDLLGEPWLESESWGFALYTLSDQRRDVWWMMAPLLPVPVGVFKREVNAYTLITWAEDGTVAACSSGTVVNGAEGEDSMLIWSDHLALAVEADSQQPAIILWAGPGRLESFLEAQRESASCTLVVGCDAGERCPDIVVGFDDDPPLVRAPKFSTWFAPDGCRGYQDCIPTLVYPFDLAPESHRLQLRTGYPLCKGEADIEFTCTAGQVLFARVGAEKQRQRRDCRMTLTADFRDELPPEWAYRSVALWRNGAWIVQP